MSVIQQSNESQKEKNKARADAIDLSSIDYEGAYYYYKKLHDSMLDQYKERFVEVYHERLEQELNAEKEKVIDEATREFENKLLGSEDDKVNELSRAASRKMFEDLEELIQKLLDIYYGNNSNEVEAKIKSEIGTAIRKLQNSERTLVANAARQQAAAGETLRDKIKKSTARKMDENSTSATYKWVEDELGTILRKQGFNSKYNFSKNDQKVISADNMTKIMQQAFGYIRRNILWNIRANQITNNTNGLLDIYTSEIRPQIAIAGGFFQESVMTSGLWQSLKAGPLYSGSGQRYDLWLNKKTLFREAGAKKSS